jgi:hypothetical protein
MRLKSLNNQTDFDSAIRRFDPSSASEKTEKSAWLELMHSSGTQNGGGVGSRTAGIARGLLSES